MKPNILKLTAILLISAGCFSCRSTHDDNQTLSLEGTSWKLSGIVDIETGALKILEPQDCEECYTLTFEADNTFSAFSSANKLRGNYNAEYKTYIIHVANFGGTKLAERGDGGLWWDIIPSVKSFSLKKDELKLYFNNKYLLFKEL